MTVTVIIMIIIGIIICLASFFVSEKFSNRNENLQNLMTLDDDYEFSERELRIIRRKIEDVIANQAKDILYETNEALANMANEKTMALGDYAVAVCEQIEKNHKEVMFLYSMLDDKQKDIMKTVRIVNDANNEAKDMLEKVKRADAERFDNLKVTKQSALDQLTALTQKKKEVDSETSKQNGAIEQDANVETETNSDIMVSETQVQTEASITEEVHVNEPIEETIDSFENDIAADDMEDVFAELDQTDINFDEVLEEEFRENENSNDIILEMHRNGNSIIDIAKQLGLGVGEVKLVIDLYRGE